MKRTLICVIFLLFSLAVFGNYTVTQGTNVKFSEKELNIIATNYIHCSAHWNAILTDSSGVIRGGASPAELIGFVNRPDENWTRTVYNMDGKNA